MSPESIDSNNLRREVPRDLRPASDRALVMPPSFDFSIRPQSICSHATSEFQETWAGKHLAKLTQWRLGISPGGQPIVSSADLKALTNDKKIVRSIQSINLFRELMGLSAKEITELTGVGEKMCRIGVPKLVGLNLLAQDGIPLLNGERAKIGEQLLLKVAQLSALCETQAVRWSVALPANLKDGVAINKAVLRESNVGPLKEHEKFAAFGIAYSLASLNPEKQQTIVRLLENNIGGVKPSFALSFRTEFVDFWMRHQLSKAWTWRKVVEPSEMPVLSAIQLDDLNTLLNLENKYGTNHPDVQKLLAGSRYQDLPIENQIFVSRMGTEILAYLRMRGQKALCEMREVGLKIKEIGVSVKPGEFTDPTSGVPLNNGEIARVKDDLIWALSYDNHEAWTKVRAWQRANLGEHNLALKPRPDSEVSWDITKPNALWFGDMRNAYGLCYAMAVMSEAQFATLLAGSIS